MPPRLELGGGVFVGALFAAVTVHAAIQRLLRQFRDRHSKVSPATRLRPRLTLRAVAFWQATLAGFLWLLFQLGFSTPESVGFSRRESPLIAFLAGVLVYGALITAYGVVLRTLNVAEQRSLASLRNMARTLPTKRRARCAVIAVICLGNPVTEELVFRGILVHQAVLLVGQAWGVIALGALVNSLNHAYQGWRAAPFHLIFYGVAVALLYSPYGMAAVLGLHFVGDALPYLGFRERLREYRRSRKRARGLKPA